MSIVHLCHNLNCWKQRKLELNNTQIVFFYSFVSLFKQNVYLKIWKNDISWLLIEYLKLWFDQSMPTKMFRFTVWSFPLFVITLKNLKPILLVPIYFKEQSFKTLFMIKILYKKQILYTHFKKDIHEN